MMTPVDNFGSEEIYNTVRRESGSMPNGRSGGFRISLAQLEAAPGFAGRDPGRERVRESRSEERDRDRICSTARPTGGGRLARVEQDHKWYIATSGWIPRAG